VQVCTLLNGINAESAVIRFYASEEGTLQGAAMYPDIFDGEQFEQWFSIWEQDMNTVTSAVRETLERKNRDGA
jgi:hypothetical protein